MPHAVLVLEKDLKRFRFILLSWLGVVGVTQGIALLGGTLLSTQLMFRIIQPLVLQSLSVLQAVLMIIFVPLIIQADPTVGTTAFWMTRPVSRFSLLRAKVVLVGSLFVGLPLLLEIVVLAVNGLGWKDILPAAVLIAIEKSACVAPVFLMAGVTEKFHKFVLTGMAAALAGLTAGALFSVLARGLFLGGAMAERGGEDGFLIPGMTAVSLSHQALMIFVCAFLIAYQYKTRRTSRTVLGMIAGIVLIPVAFVALPQGALERRPVQINPPQTVIRTGQMTVAGNMVSGNRLTRDRVVSMPVQVLGLHPGLFAILRRVGPTPFVSYGPGVKVFSSGALSSPVVLLSSRRLQDSIQHALQDFVVMNPYDGEEPRYAVLRLPEPVYDRYQKQSGTYEGVGTFDVYEYRIGVKMPLIRGAKSLAGGTESVILDIVEKPSGVTVIVGEKSLSVSSGFRPGAVPYGEDTSLDFTRTYVLVHPVRKEAFLVDTLAQPVTRIDLAWPAGAGRLDFKVKRYDFSSLNPGDSLPGGQQSWLKEAVLIRLDALDRGSLNRRLRLSGFVLPETSDFKK